MTTHLKSNDCIFNNLLWFLLVVVCFITFYPLTQTGFVNGDDYAYFLNSTPSQWLDGAKSYSEFTGRFYFILVKWVYAVPYLIHSSFYFHFTLIVPIICSFILFIWLIKRIFNNDIVPILTGLFICIGYQICGFHSATAGYPLYFSLSVSFILIAFHLILNYYKSKKYSNIIISALIFGIATIFYESYLLYYIVIFLIIFYHEFSVSTIDRPDSTIKTRVISMGKLLLPYIICGIAYLLTYYLYYSAHPSAYGGNKFSDNLSIINFCKTLWDMAIDAFPLASFYDYRFFLADSSLSPDQYVYSIWHTFFHAGLIPWIKGFLVLAIFIPISRLITFQNISYKKILFIAITALCFVFIPHLLLALSEKYSTSVQNGYVTVYFSFFAVVLFFLSLFALYQKKSDKHKIVRIIFTGLFSFLLLFITVITQYTNTLVTNDLRISQRRFELLEEVLQPPHINPNEPIYMERLSHTPSYFGKVIATSGSNYSSHIKLINNIELNQVRDYAELFNSYKNSSEPVNFIYYSQASKSEDGFMILARCSGTQLCEKIELLRFDSLLLYYYSSYKQFAVSVVSDSLSPVTLNNKAMEMYGGFHFANVNSLPKEKMVSICLRGKQLNPLTCMAQNTLYPNVQPLLLGNYPQKYKHDYTQYYMRRLKNDTSLMQMISEKAKSQHKSIEQALRDDAHWLVYFNDQDY